MCCMMCVCLYANNMISPLANTASYQTCPQDSLALVALYNATNGPNWNNPWDLSQPMSTWSGVQTNAAGCVTTLWLINNNLSGSLPPEIGDLTSLTDLQLNDNQLTGSLPAEMANMSSLLYLIINNNQLSGCYDPALSALCTQLDPLLSNNFFISNGNNFDATWNDFCNMNAGECVPCTGDYQALVDLYNATDGPNWTVSWDLTQPMSTWNGITLDANGCVTEIVLINNQLTGYIPSAIGDIPNLIKLWLINNQLSGTIPASIGNLDNLADLQLNGNQLSGSIPAGLATLSGLTVLALNDNQLSGCYDSDLSNLCSQLSAISNNDASISSGNSFDASWSDFCILGSGACPPCSLGDSLVLVDLYNSTDGANWDNNIQLWDLTQPMSTWSGVTLNADGCVSELDLTGYALNGVLPPSIGDLSELTKLFIPYNFLTGTLPAELGNLSMLTELRVDHNAFVGCYAPALLSLCGQLTNGSNTNISEENNFDIPWEDFCSTGICNSCPISLAQSNAISTGLFQADYNVISTGTILTGGDVQFKAGTIICLDKNFTVEPDADFSAEIEGCGN